MGYRSEVAITMSASDYRGLWAMVRLLEEDKLREEVTDCLNDAEIKHGDSGDVLLRWEWVKWYDFDEEYAGPYHIMKYLNSLDEDDYYFVRVGEELNDVEISGGYYDGDFQLGASTQITIN